MEMRCTLPDSLLSGLSDFVAARIGLHFPQERWRDLERGLIAATPEWSQPDAQSCARWLLEASLTQSHIEILASHLTVGETYFFREKRSLEILETQIVPELLRARQGGERHLRIWSAGCCTGEEPYSIAILLDRLIPDQTDWTITLLATDINPRFLRKAAEGVYGEWSFRDTPKWVRARYFKQRKDGRFELSAHIRRKVTFSYLNLADDAYPSLLNNTNAMDVIFCRNVLMYFTAQRAKKVTRNFHRSLVEDGWLIVNATETSAALFPLFTPVNFHGAVLYRKAQDNAAGVAATHYQPPALQPALFQFHFEGETRRRRADDEDSTFGTARNEGGSQHRVTDKMELELFPPEMPAEPPGQTATMASNNALTQEQNDCEALSLNARDCANQGRLVEAIEWCAKAIAADKMNPARHYLLAAIQQEQGQLDAAAESLNRALYLDSGFVLAHFALGNLRLSQGKRREAERHFTNTLATLQAHPHDEVLPESEGLTAGRLVEIVTSVLASLPHAVAANA